MFVEPEVHISSFIEKFLPRGHVFGANHDGFIGLVWRINGSESIDLLVT